MGLTRAAVLVAALATLGAGCGGTLTSGEPRRGTEPGASDWIELRPAPLSPRETATGVWTGREVLIVGGSDAPPCPPSADCTLPETPPLSDGAALDPASGTWRQIAPAPVPVGWAHGAVVGDTAYFLVPGGRRPGEQPAFLAYRIEGDRWDELPFPPKGGEWYEWYGLVRAGERLVAFRGSDEHGERPDYVFDPANETWSELPDDPQTNGFDRFMVWSGSELVLLDHELVPNPGSEEPLLLRVAAFDFESETWRRLPDSEEVLGAGPWLGVDGRIVAAALGTADGGETNNWGREYPYGGILDPATGAWSALPALPADVKESTFSAGVRSEQEAVYGGTDGWVLDATTEQWIELPDRSGGDHVQGETVVAAGSDLFIFGGARFASGTDIRGTLLAEASMWSPAGEASHEPPPAEATPAASALDCGLVVRAGGCAGFE